VAPDGSVWFGEEAVPGVGHLYPNGTLVEYAWPFNYLTAPSVGGSLLYKTDIWGIALWNGRVWASDTAMNQLVGLDPSTDSFTTIRLPANDSFPYTMTAGPDGSLWFTELSSSKIGRVFSNGTLVEYPLSAGGHEETPAEIAFLNSTLGYYVTVGGTPGGGTSALYAFNPSKFSPHQVIGNGTLSFPDSLALMDGKGIWIDLHGPSMVGFYNLTDGAYTLYPISTITYTNTVLPYFIRANDSSSVWFNEHYGNKIAVIDKTRDALTEYSESDPPVDNGSKIENALTFALGQRGAWFTAFTGNFIGYVDASHRPSYSVAVDGEHTMQLKPGQEANVTVSVTGDASHPLAIQFSDSETFTAVPKNIAITSSVGEIQSLSGGQNFVVTIRASGSLTPGNYTVLVTVNGGLVRESVYLFLQVQSQ
jgi:streptogramin lyase